MSGGGIIRGIRVDDTMRSIPFVDAHIHLWDLDKISYPWLTPPFSSDSVNGDVSPIAKTYLLKDYENDAANWNVVAAVHVDAGAAAEAALDETRWLQAMTDEKGRPDAIVAFAALHDPDVERLLEAHSEHKNVRGIRHIVNYHEDPRRTYSPADVTMEDAWRRGFALLGKYDLSFDLQAYPGQFEGLAGVIAANPQIPVMINHAGMPFHDERDLWRDAMRRLAELPNIAVKISGLGITDHDWTEDSIRPYVLETIDFFGARRTMFASDFPTDKLYAGYDTCLNAYASIIASFSEDERRDMWGRNAARLYHIEAV